jgi:hypothetical protein
MMYVPMLILALTCAGFGVFASKQVVPGLLMPVSGTFDFTGAWPSSMVGVLVLVSIGLGILIYLLGNVKNTRSSESFIGGEKLQEETSFSTLEFLGHSRSTDGLPSCTAGPGTNGLTCMIC